MLLSLDDRIFGLDAQLIFQLIFTGIAIFLLFISVASLLSEKLVAASLDEEKQNALIEQTLREIGDDTWQSR